MNNTSTTYCLMSNRFRNAGRYVAAPVNAESLKATIVDALAEAIESLFELIRIDGARLVMALDFAIVRAVNEAFFHYHDKVRNRFRPRVNVIRAATNAHAFGFAPAPPVTRPRTGSETRAMSTSVALGLV